MIRTLVVVAVLGLCQPVIQANQCTATGRFPNDDVPDCRGYSMCIDGGSGTFYQYNLTCPQSYLFNPLDKLCTTTFACLNLTVPFTCKDLGAFENPVGNCSTFVACIEGLQNMTTPRLVECSAGTVFNPLVSVCVNETEYECPIPQEQTSGALDISVTGFTVLCLVSIIFIVPLE